MSRIIVLSHDQVVDSCSFLDACARAKIADQYAVIMLKHSFINGDTEAFIAGLQKAYAKVSTADSIPKYGEVTQLLNQLESIGGAS